MIRVLERRTTPYDLASMVDRSEHYYRLLGEDPRKAAAYWRFVERGLREYGFDPAACEDLICDADEIALSMPTYTEAL